MINVLHVVLGLQVGGLEKVVLDLVDTHPADIKPFIVCLEKRGELGQQYKHLEIFELHKESGINLKIIPKLVSLTKELNIDIIHTHNPGPHIYGAITGFLTRRPVVHTKHGRNYPTEKRKVWLNKIASLLTNKIVAVSQDAADVCLDAEKIPISKVTVILNGIDTNRFCEKAYNSDAMGIPIRIGIVARLSEEKDHLALLSACKMLSAHTTHFHLDIVGDGPLKETLVAAVKKLELDSYISFRGTRHDVPELLRQLHIFVLSSTSEGISLTLLEAMATGLPVVATNVGGTPEVVIDGETGYLVPPKNPGEMARKLLLLINDENKRRQMGEKGRERIIALFSSKETGREYASLYRSLLSTRSL
jgi:sugar transferase (PEP-CTERM/EpsH1 system associated)